MIPKILHQTAKTAEIPGAWQPLQARVRALHPAWEYRLWTDEDNLRLIEAEYPELKAVYTGLPRGIMRADMIRYVYMHRFGGLYLDLDYEFLKPFDLLDKRLVLPRESDDEAPLFLGNCIFASEAGHPYWRAVLDSLRTKPPLNLGDYPEQDILNGTGPGFLTRVWLHEYSGPRDGVDLPPRAAFHPPRPATLSEQRAIEASGQSYGIHHCHGSWREHPGFWFRLRRKLKALLGVHPS